MPVDVVPHPVGRGTVEVLRSGDANVVFGRAGAVDPPWPRDVVRRLVRFEPLRVLVGDGDPWADLPELIGLGVHGAAFAAVNAGVAVTCGPDPASGVFWGWGLGLAGHAVLVSSRAASWHERLVERAAARAAGRS